MGPQLNTLPFLFPSLSCFLSLPGVWSSDCPPSHPSQNILHGGRRGESREVALLSYQYFLSGGYGICGTYCRKGKECSIDWIRKLTKPQEREKMLQAARAITWSNRPVNATKKKDAASSEDLFPAAVEINQQYRFGVASL